MPTASLCFRQIHLDFHTSESIPDIARDFDADQFAERLVSAHVDSVTCFARCHHGWLYYPSTRFPDRIHPNLKRPNLLGEQIEACHARGIRVPIYITVQWDHFTANEHPDWLVVDANGRTHGTPPWEAGFYRFLCVNSPYLDFLKTQTREVLETLPCDGIFFDIVKPTDDSSKWTRDQMLAAGLDPADQSQRIAFGQKVIDRFKKEMTTFVRQFSDDCTIFYNAGHVGPRHRPVLDAYTHLELESLPTGGWGYQHFPLAARFARTLGLPFLGMTGKFHTMWGDFSSYKNTAALDFECFHSLALGGGCSIGDQLHPFGELCEDTYRLIGSTYASVKEKQPWCEAAEPLVDVAVMTSEEFTSNGSNHGSVPDSIRGAVRILQELKQQFDVIDSKADFRQYRVVVLPDEIPVSRELADQLQRYVDDGGALIASHRAGLSPDGSDFSLTYLGVNLVGDAPYSPDFLVPGRELSQGMPARELVMYQRGTQAKTSDGAQVLAEVRRPFFERTWDHFCSHRQTPSSGETVGIGAVRNGRCIWLAHPVFSQYQDNAPMWCRQLVANALAILLADPLVRIDAPSSTIATLNVQPDHHRLVLHLLHYTPERRGSIDVVEDTIPLTDISVSVGTDMPVSGVALVPQEKSIPFENDAQRVSFVVPLVEGHQMIAISLGEA